jgi:6-phosphogluconolactonase (cycloisomerase 2 family)
MSPSFRPIALLSAWLEIASAANIFVSHYQGTIASLTLTGSGTSYTLAQNSSLTVGGQPSWLTWDSASRTLYAGDETGSGSASVWSVAAATNGKLTQSGKASAPLGSVHNALYGNGYLAQAH